MKKMLIAVAVLILLLAGLLFVTRTIYPTNIADTTPDHRVVALRTRHYKTDLATFAGETEKLIPTLTKYGSAWKFVGAEKSDDKVVLKAEVPVIVFTDDLSVTAEKEDGGIVVNIHSNSRVGKSDLGENRRHLETILAALDQKFRK